jgi:5'-nucleotidase
MQTRKTPYNLSGITVISDMDDVLFDWSAAFMDAFTKDNPGRTILPPERRDTFNMFRPEDAEHHEQIRATLDKPGFYATLEPIAGSVEALLEMHNLGIDVIIATSPWRDNPTCIDDKLNSLDKFIGPGWSERAIFTSDKTRVRGTYLFDDKPDVVGGVIPEWEHIFFTQPPNAVRTDRRRVDHMSEALPLIFSDLGLL